MPTEAQQSPVPLAVLLICHQDDECGTYFQILRHRQQGRRVVCACFTRGVMGDRDETPRNTESIDVLGRLGVDASDIVFAGSLLGIDDQALIDNMPAAAEWLHEWLGSLGPVEVIYTTAWEGGHSDHDTLHAISAQVCHELGLLDKLRQYSLYNSYQRPWQFFRALYPLPVNGPVERTRIPWPLRFRFLSFSFQYPSQIKGWLGIFPFFVLHYFFRGTAQLQAVSLERIAERPHEGALYYEKRGFSTWDHVQLRISEWLASRPHTPAHQSQNANMLKHQVDMRDLTASNPKWSKIARFLGMDALAAKMDSSLCQQAELTARLVTLEQQLAASQYPRESTDKGAQMILALRYKELARQGEVLPFDAVEFRNYSQFGEDGILHYLFSLVGTTNRRAVEMCAGNGIECNSTNLILNHDWRALLLDGGKKNVEEGRRFYSSHPRTQFIAPVIVHSWLKRDNVNSLLRDTGFTGEVDLFSLDMDGTDYWIWDAITEISPRVVVVEVNLHMGSEPLTVPYSDKFMAQWIELPSVPGSASSQRRQLQNWTMYGGASLAAFNQLAKSKGYRLIGCNSMGFNVLFMRDDVGADLFPEVSLASCQKPGASDDVKRANKILLQQGLQRV